jgi:hypothetical protein
VSRELCVWMMLSVFCDRLDVLITRKQHVDSVWFSIYRFLESFPRVYIFTKLECIFFNKMNVDVSHWAMNSRYTLLFS